MDIPEISKQQIADLLVSAFEGGSNYWARIVRTIPPTTTDFVFDPNRLSPAYQYPLNPGGAVILRVREGGSEYGELRLDLDRIHAGLKCMADKFPKHFAEIVTENADAETGDVFLQCALFGDVIFS